MRVTYLCVYLCRPAACIYLFSYLVDLPLMPPEWEDFQKGQAHSSVLTLWVHNVPCTCWAEITCLIFRKVTACLRHHLPPVDLFEVKELLSSNDTHRTSRPNGYHSCFVYSIGPGFKSRPGDRLYWQVFRGFLSPSGQMPGYYLKLYHTTSFHSLSNFLFILSLDSELLTAS
jgi:hypothetical protein